MLGTATATIALAHTERGAQATQILLMDLSDLAAEADRIVVAEVLSTRSEWNRAHTRISTRIEISVSESWKGAAPAGRRIVIVQPGGSVGDIEMRVHGVPAFEQGERAVLFLRDLAPSGVAVVGMAQGKRVLRFEAATQRWVVEPTDRSAAVTIQPDGRLIPAPPDTVVWPLEDLRARVRTLVSPR
jgi:hypothetical protein